MNIVEILILFFVFLYFSFILSLVQHKKQIDTIIEKICARFKLATTERQWCDLSYCLSILSFSVKSKYDVIYVVLEN